MQGLASAGYYVVAPDLRGYGRTTGWDASDFDRVDFHKFSPINLIRDQVVLVHALGYSSVHCLVGHDFGAVAASYAALARRDLFERVVLMSHPYKGTRDLFRVNDARSHPEPDIHEEMLKLPEPRKHYKWYYATRDAASDMNSEKGMQDFLRNYFYQKSASWPGNQPHPLKSWTASELAQMPYYYVMPASVGMPEAMKRQPDFNGNTERSLTWLPDDELAVYSKEWARTGFQGGLTWYRVMTDPEKQLDMDAFASKKLEQPCLMLLGRQDWGSYQEPGVLETMGDRCSEYKGTTWIEDAGHWMQQEQPQKVQDEILRMCRMSL